MNAIRYEPWTEHGYTHSFREDLPGADRLEPSDKLWRVRPSELLAASYPPPRAQHGHGRQRLLGSA